MSANQREELLEGLEIICSPYPLKYGDEWLGKRGLPADGDLLNRAQTIAKHLVRKAEEGAKWLKD